MLSKYFLTLWLKRKLKSIVVNIHWWSGSIIRHFRFIHERMFWCQRLLHKYLGCDLDGIPQDAISCPGWIPESSGLIPGEDRPGFRAFQQLVLFLGCGSGKLDAVLRKEDICNCCHSGMALVKGAQRFPLNHSLSFTKFSNCFQIVCFSDSEMTSDPSLSFPVATTLSNQGTP